MTLRCSILADVSENARKVSVALRSVIRKSGESLSVIAERTGVDPGRLSRFVRGERGLTLRAVDALAKHFGLTLAKVRKKP
jgi:transcriptional regulator with XRE-family HTH domain